MATVAMRGNRDENVVLNAVVKDLLTNPELERERGEYSSKPVKRFVMVNDRDLGLCWPVRFRPSVQGFDYQFYSEGPKSKRSGKPLLGLRLDQFGLSQDHLDSLEGNVIVTMLNAGSPRSKDDPIGGISVHYVVEKQGDVWRITLLKVSSP